MLKAYWYFAPPVRVIMKNYINLILHVIVPVFLGALIYILFRKESLTVFIWIDSISLLDEVMVLRDISSGLKEDLPAIILYSLPDGIWVYSATYLMIKIWGNHLKDITAWFWISLPFICSITAELLQSIQLIEGHYCSYDMMFYVSFFVLALININTGGRHHAIQ